MMSNTSLGNRRRKHSYLEGINRRWAVACAFVHSHWKKGLAAALILFIAMRKDVVVDLHMQPRADQPTTDRTFAAWRESVWFFNPRLPRGKQATRRQARMEESYPLNTSLLELSGANSGVEKAEKRSASNMRKDDNLANDFSNLTFQSRAFATHEDSAERAEKKRKQLRYVERFADVAREEMKKYGIPASIKLAQGLLESNAGESRLAVRNKNHFGIKCFSRSCKKGHCSNFTDDHHKDFFRIYPNSWESYRAHSLLLKAERYRSLYQLDSDDFVGWAYGLKKAGYATDDNYAEKLIELILDLELHHYDR